MCWICWPPPPCRWVCCRWGRAARRRAARIFAAGELLYFVKLLAVPAAAWGLALLLGLKAYFQSVLVLAALPTASSAYILAVRMGGDGRTVATIITVNVFVAMVTLPLWLEPGLVSGFGASHVALPRGKKPWKAMQQFSRNRDKLMSSVLRALAQTDRANITDPRRAGSIIQRPATQPPGCGVTRRTYPESAPGAEGTQEEEDRS